MAPATPLKELAANPKKKSQNKFCDAIRKKYDEYQKRDYEAWTEILNIGRMVANCRNGKLLLLRHALDNRYLFVKRDGRFSDNKTIGGLFQFYSTKLTAEWLSSKPERDPVCPSDNDQIEEYISGVKIIQDYYDRRFFDDQYEELESLSGQDYGTWITRFRFDPDKKDIVCELLDFPACRWDIRFRAEDSSYFIYESKCATSILSKLLDADVTEDSEANEHYGIQLIEQIARQGGNVAGEGKEYPYGTYNQMQGETIVTEMWLQPEAYCEIELNEDEKTVSGINIPAGRSLIDVFPEGMCVVGINGMKTIFGVYAENHKDHIVTGIYHLQSFSGVGKGISDAVDVKKEMDDLHSQTMAYIKAHGTPSWGYNKDVVSEEDARSIGKPRKNIPFDFTNAPDGARTINDVVQALTPGNPGQGVWQMGQQLENYLQMSMQVTNFSDGLPGVDNKTATGVVQGQQLSQTMLVPQHRNKADHRKRADKVIFNLFKRYKNIPQFFATRDLNGITKGKYLSGNDFTDVDIDFEIVADSEIPQTPLIRAQSMSALLQQSGGVLGLLQAVQMNPDITGQIATTLGAKNLSIPKRTDIARVCRKRIEQAKQILATEMQLQSVMTQVTGQQPDNSNLAATIVSQLKPPISTKEPYYTEKVSWLAELLDCDEMQYADSHLRYVVEEMIDRHLQAATFGKAEVEQDSNIGMLMSQAPMILGEQYMNEQNQMLQQNFQQQQAAQQQQQVVAQAQAQGQSQLQAQAQQAQIDNEQAHSEHQRALAVNNQQHAQNLQLAAVQHMADIEKIKATPRPSPAKK